jgi:hypothetical protein
MYSERRIAELMGVSRGTVRAIASDATFERRRLDVLADRLPQKRKLPRRCPICGGLVYFPCRLCKVRAYAARMRSRPTKRHRTPAKP